MDSDIYALTRGEAPLLVSFPHAGTAIRVEVGQRVQRHARKQCGAAVPLRGDGGSDGAAVEEMGDGVHVQMLTGRRPVFAA